MLGVAAEVAIGGGVSVLDVVGIIVGAGTIGAVVNYLLGRHKPKVDRGQLRVAEAHQEASAVDAFQERILGRLTSVEARLDSSETREAAARQVIRVLFADIDELEDHIREGKPPPPPKGKRHELNL